MSVQFIDNCEWEAIDAPRWSLGSWGTDRATVPYCGRRDKKEAWLTSVKRFASLPGIGTMRLLEAVQSGGSISIPMVDLNYIGFRNGQIPPAKAVDDFCTQCGQGSGSYSQGGETISVSGSFTYKASRTVWTWYETATPADAPRYSTVQNAIDPLAPSSIISYSMTDDTNGRLRNVPYAAFVAVFNSLTRATVVSDYQREPLVPGALWACSATVEFKLVG